MDDARSPEETADVQPKASPQSSDSLRSADTEADHLCDRFEMAWRDGGVPQIQEYLASAPDRAKAALFRNLLAVELVLRRSAGQQPTPEEYKRQFPEQGEVIDAVFAGLEAPVAAEATESEASTGATEQPQQIGRYRVESLLGEGGYGRVYRAHDDELNRPVAIKVPQRRRVSRPEDVQQYLAEARAVASLDHPHIVPVYDVGRTDDGLCFVVSKFIEGSDLATRVKEEHFAHYESAELVATVAEALHYAHLRGLVHRDVKPGNILLDSAGKPYVVDFGLALREEDVGQRGRVAGTVFYMSPEQARGESHRVDGRSDVFSLGVVLYELLAGRRPFQGDSRLEVLEQIVTSEPRPLRQRDDTIPRELERICLKSLSKRVSDRYVTALDLAEDLRHYLQTASPPQRPADQPTAGPAAPPERPSSDKLIRIVPKGLRSFDAEDADFFLELLPGPRDRDGLPESIRFWKNRIEERDPDKTFAVGLIYGPSGCGKSSLLKAGLLPRLDDSVIAVYVEATARETETRLLRVLGKQCPHLPKDLGLSEALAVLRRGEGIAPREKILIVLDQFEQWLHAWQGEENTELVRALRQCDGQRVQCVVMVRDDFWLAATRFMHDLEIRLVEGQNSAVVDLFGLRHARGVLGAFGRAFGALPEKAGELTDQHQEFLKQATAGLAEQGKVVCIRLALFAEMLKEKTWVPATLKEVGGTEGIGVTFLEETFSSTTAPPEHRLHQKAARSVLKALLPEQGTDIRGHMRSYQELLEASGYDRRPQDFEELLQILDGELRLVTPTDPEGLGSDDHLAAGPEGRHYQLTHDYLVPSLREWLNRKRRETRRGRVQLLLEERTQQWGPSRQSRLLPSLGETLRIALHTRRAQRTPLQREMLRRAFAFHRLRLSFAATVVTGLAFALWMLIQPPTQFELLQTFADPGETTQRRIAAFDRLHVNDVRIFPHVLRTLEELEMHKDSQVRHELPTEVEGDDSDVILYALGQLSKLAEEIAQSNAADAPASVREPLLALVGHKSEAVRAAAFDLLSRLASPSQVVETIRLRASQDKQIPSAPLIGYVNTLDLESLPAQARSEVLRNVIAIVADDPDQALVAACVEKLDRLDPSQLRDGLVKAYESSDVKTAASDSLLPYAAKTSTERVERIGRCVEQRLVKLIPRSGEEIPYTFELEFLVRALCELKVKGLARVQYGEAANTLAYVLENRELLEDPDMLDTVVEAFVRLNHDKRDLDSLRSLLGREPSPKPDPAQDAAAWAVGELEDLESLDTLVHFATDQKAYINLRVQAIRSLGKLAATPEPRAPAASQLHKIVDTLREVLGENPTEERPIVRDVVREALIAYGDLGNSESIELVFPFILEPSVNMRAIAAVLNVLSRQPQYADDVVCRYLRWRTKGAPGLEVFLDNPDKALIGFDSYLEPSEQRERAARSVALALARAAAGQAPNGADGLSVQQRKYANGLLARFLRAEDAPPLDSDADDAKRTLQLGKWEKWWKTVRKEFGLNAARLERVSPAP